MPLRAHIPGGETDLSLNSDDPEWAGMGSNAWPSYKALGKFFSETQFPYLQSGDNDTNVNKLHYTAIQMRIYFKS